MSGAFAIRVTNFGGLVPSVSPRQLPDAAAQVAHNLDPTSAEFRPLAQDTQVVANTGVTNPKTLYRLDRVAGGDFNTQMTLNWVVKAEDMNFVKGQLNDDTTERTYATYNDGSAPPRVFDVNDLSTGRRLGVPAPTVKPTITVNVTDEFTVDERATGISTAREQVAKAITDNLTVVWLGAPYPGSTTTGYVNLQDNGPADPVQAKMARVYRTSSKNGAKTGALSVSYSTYGVESFTWVWDPSVQPFWATSNSTSPSWQSGSPGNYWDHICIAFHAYGQGYRVNAAGMAAALAAIERPGTTTGEKLFTTDQITGPEGLVTRLVEHCDPEGPLVKPKISELAQKVAELKNMLDGGTIGAAVSTMAAFYAKSEVTAIFNAAIENVANQIYDAAYTAFRSGTPQDAYTGAGP